MKTYRELLKNGEQKLAAAGIENAAGEAWYLFEDAFSVSKMDYLLDQNRICPEEAQIDKYESYLHKRSIEHVPMQYLLGNQEFMGLSFSSDAGCVDPASRYGNIGGRNSAYCFGSGQRSGSVYRFRMHYPESGILWYISTDASVRISRKRRCVLRKRMEKVWYLW